WPTKLPAPRKRTRLRTWLVALPALAVLLAANWGYHWLLRSFIDAPRNPTVFPFRRELSTWLVLLGCVQPAIVEEIFCRFLALGILYRHTNIHTAVLISAVMFGLAHIFAPLSIPILTLAVVGLDYPLVEGW